MASLQVQDQFFFRKATVYISHEDIIDVEKVVAGGLVVGSLIAVVFKDLLAGSLSAALAAIWYLVKRTDQKNNEQGCTIVFQQISPFHMLWWVPISIQ